MQTPSSVTVIKVFTAHNFVPTSAPKCFLSASFLKIYNGFPSG